MLTTANLLTAGTHAVTKKPEHSINPWLLKLVGVALLFGLGAYTGEMLLFVVCAAVWLLALGFLEMGKKTSRNF